MSKPQLKHNLQLNYSLYMMHCITFYQTHFYTEQQRMTCLLLALTWSQCDSRTITPPVKSHSVYVCILFASAPLKLHWLKLLQQLTMFPFPSASTEAPLAAAVHVAMLAHCFTMAIVEPEHTHTETACFWRYFGQKAAQCFSSSNILAHCFFKSCA